ncbi:hypothetical protein D770_02110 [Flammeovirgaceae bacterium 311]|nr:hypothetical protein D770_02110 [Flammeovirgaceae bacterium 311]
MKKLLPKKKYRPEPSLAVVLLAWLYIFILTVFLVSCDRSKQKLQAHENNSVEATSMPEVSASLPHFGNLVEVKTNHMNFILSDEIPSGWTTFRYSNESNLTHFMLIDRMPVFKGEQKTYDDFKEVSAVFMDAMDLINAGKSEEGFAEFSRFPPWFSKVVFSGGVGLVSPGEMAQTTVFMEPGTYVVECYVKTGGKFHPMSRQLIVKEEAAHGSAPEPSLKVTLSREGGIEFEDEPTAGLHTIAVYFKDQRPHEHFLGHDVHLVKLKADAELAELDAWMDWSDPDGLNTPAPAKFIGGVQDMPAGKTAYFTLNLEPGKYALVSEVPNPSSKGMLIPFNVLPVKEVASH